MKPFRLLTIVLMGITVLACKNKKNTQVSHENPASEKAILVDNFGEYRSSAAVTIGSVTIEGDLMKLAVSYSGGCQEHTFALVGEKNLGKSLPPQRSILLFHNSNGDNCRELITKEITFNIRELGFEVGKEVKLNLKDWKEPLSYTLK